MLRFAEEIMLLLLDDENGSFARVPDRLVRYALGGGVLMELALEDRIDTDLDKLVLIDNTPLQDSLVDPTLSDNCRGDRNARYALLAGAHCHARRRDPRGCAPPTGG